MCCREGGGGRRSLAGEAAEVGRGAADGPASLRRSQGGGCGDQVSPLGRGRCWYGWGVTLVRGFPEPVLHTLPSLGDPGWLQGLWIAWKDSSGLPEAWKVFSLLLTPSPLVPLSLFLLSP